MLRGTMFNCDISDITIESSTFFTDEFKKIPYARNSSMLGAVLCELFLYIVNYSYKLDYSYVIV